ncbi:MAG: DUF4175 family protein [Vicinamibacterales bacterium]
MSDAQHELSAFIAGVRRRWQLRTAAWTLGTGSLGAALLLSLTLALDRVAQPHGLGLILLATASLLVALGTLGFAFWRMPRRPDDRRVARFIEEQAAQDRAHGALDDAIVTAVSLDAGGGPPGAFSGLLAGAAAARLRQLTPATIVPATGLRRAGLAAAAGIVALALASVAGAPMFVSAGETAWLTWRPQALQIEVRPGDARVPLGRPMTIRAVVRLRGRIVTRLTPTLIVSAAGDRRELPMAADGAGFTVPIEAVDRTFTYQVLAAPQTSRTFTVSALVAPKVTQIDAHYEYPAFTGLAPRDEEDGGDVYAPAGTRVTLRVHTDKPVTAAMTTRGVQAGSSLRQVSPTLFETSLWVKKDDSYRVMLADADGLRGGGETEYFIRLMDDRPPEVRILKPGGDQQITSLEEVAIEARADDDYGVGAFDLVYGVAGRPERITPFTRVSGTTVAKVGGHLLSAEDLHVQPGDVITVYARARDVARGKRSTETRSDLFFLEVRPFNEEFVSTESQAMAASGDPQLDSLIAAQKEIINATWNIERRSTAGRSSTDVKAISQAQLELRERAAKMSGDSGRPLPFQLPQQIGGFGPARRRPVGAEAVAGAVRSMGLAAQQLDVEKTKDAIPHEMAALQGLLQAQAEIRRRQVAQQQASGSGNGGGRQGQDLSALFDKELQRQQRNNYETRSQVDPRPDRERAAGDSALDRIRDLAKRQEDLSSRERELAQSAASAEERKRQLDKLARDQEELRQQVEQVGQQLDQSGPPRGSANGRQDGQPDAGRAAGRATGARGSGGASGSAMRDAAQQMRGSASDLQRQDPAAAAASAARAAEQLREMEQRLRSGSASGRDRASGDLRMEAQQLVDSQRRIAAEADRLGQPGASAEARRRLADQQHRLADGVDALERAARAAGEAGKGRGASAADEARAASEAAAALRQERIAERMRDSAAAMRQGSGPGREGAAQQDLARALDQAVSRIGGRGGADARRLSQQLDDSRAMRERLDRLAEQIQQAEAAARTPPAGGRPGSTTGGPPPAGGRGSGSPTLAQLREQYARELARARDSLGQPGQGGHPQGDDRGGATPEEERFSLSSPGNQAFKQDTSSWESLRKAVNLAIERHEASVSQRLARTLAEDRLSGGGSERGADAYDRLIARYYESLARTRNSPRKP